MAKPNPSAKSTKTRVTPPTSKEEAGPTADQKVKNASTAQNARDAAHQSGIGSQGRQRDFTSGKQSGNS